MAFVYFAPAVSEGNNKAILTSLKDVAEAACGSASRPLQAALVQTFADAAYNRSSFVLAGDPASVAHAAVAVSEAGSGGRRGAAYGPRTLTSAACR